MSDLKASSFVGGVHGGYNWQFANSWVAGIEADWSWTGANVSATTPWIFFASNNLVGPGFQTTLNSKLNWLATARGRIGYLVTPQALVYVTGGAAWFRLFRLGGQRQQELYSRTVILFNEGGIHGRRRRRICALEQLAAAGGVSVLPFAKCIDHSSFNGIP